MPPAGKARKDFLLGSEAEPNTKDGRRSTFQGALGSGTSSAVRLGGSMPGGYVAREWNLTKVFAFS